MTFFTSLQASWRVVLGHSFSSHDTRHLDPVLRACPPTNLPRHLSKSLFSPRSKKHADKTVQAGKEENIYSPSPKLPRCFSTPHNRRRQLQVQLRRTAKRSTSAKDKATTQPCNIRKSLLTAFCLALRLVSTLELTAPSAAAGAEVPLYPTDYWGVKARPAHQR